MLSNPSSSFSYLIVIFLHYVTWFKAPSFSGQGAGLYIVIDLVPTMKAKPISHTNTHYCEGFCGEKIIAIPLWFVYYRTE